MLMREVDEAVRQDQAKDFAQRYGLIIGGVVALALVAFGGWLWWDSSNESRAQQQSEQLVQALDELEAGNPGVADTELAELSEGSDGAAAAAAMLRAGIAVEQDRPQDAVELFDRVANNADLPAEIRDIATIRSVTVQYDTMNKQAVIDRIGPLAQPQNPYYGSAAEIVAHAYIAQGKRDQAGPLLVAVAKDENVPESIRARTRQLAGLLGYDAIEDVDAALAQITGEDPDEAEGSAVQLVE